MFCLVNTYRHFFPLDGAGLKRLFHNGRHQNDDSDWSFDDVIKFFEFLRQASSIAAIMKLGLPLLENNKFILKKILEVRIEFSCKIKKLIFLNINQLLLNRYLWKMSVLL